MKAFILRRLNSCPWRVLAANQCDIASLLEGLEYVSKSTSIVAFGTFASRCTVRYRCQVDVHIYD